MRLCCELGCQLEITELASRYLLLEYRRFKFRSIVQAWQIRFKFVYGRSEETASLNCERDR